MNHNVSILTVATDVDALLEDFNGDKARLELRVASISNRVANGVTTVEELTTELQDTETSLQELTNALPNIPEGDFKNQVLNDINDLKNEVIMLNRRMRNNGPVAMYMQQVDLDLTADRVTAHAELIGQLQTRRTELPNP
jgi:lipoate synthase